MKIKSLVKILVSILMLVIVLRMNRLEQLLAVLKSLSFTDCAFVVAGYTLGQIVSSYKWWLIARSGGIQAGYLQALRAYFIGMYVNCFGLGTLGGDVTRGLLLAQGEPHKSEALASVIADRAQGLAVLATIGAVSAFIFRSQVSDPFLAYMLFFLGMGIIVGWFAGPWLVLKLFPATNRFRQKVEGVMHVFPKDLTTIAKITTISILFHLSQIALHRIMGLAIGVEIAWSTLLVTTPFVNITSTLPISWNGLGVRERAYVYFLVPAVLSPEQAVAFGAMWLMSLTVTSAIGGIIAVATNDLTGLKAAEAK